jgi:hypothetical protein
VLLLWASAFTTAFDIHRECEPSGKLRAAETIQTERAAETRTTTTTIAGIDAVIASVIQRRQDATSNDCVCPSNERKEELGIESAVLVFGSSLSNSNSNSNINSNNDKHGRYG